MEQLEALKIWGSWWWSGVIYGLLLIVLLLVVIYRVAIAKFLAEVKTELVKCTWPWDPEQTGLRRYKQLIDSTVVVVLSSVMLAGYVAGFDLMIREVVYTLPDVVVSMVTGEEAGESPATEPTETKGEEK